MRKRFWWNVWRTLITSPKNFLLSEIGKIMRAEKYNCVIYFNGRTFRDLRLSRLFLRLATIYIRG